MIEASPAFKSIAVSSTGLDKIEINEMGVKQTVELSVVQILRLPQRF